VTCLDHADALGRQAVRVARDGKALQGRAARPMPFHRQRHRGSRLAGGRDEGAAARRPRQVRGKNLQRIRGGDRRAKACFEEGAHRAKFTGARAAWDRSHRLVCAMLAFL